MPQGFSSPMATDSTLTLVGLAGGAELVFSAASQADVNARASARMDPRTKRLCIVIIGEPLSNCLFMLRSHIWGT